MAPYVEQHSHFITNVTCEHECVDDVSGKPFAMDPNLLGASKLYCTFVRIVLLIRVKGSAWKCLRTTNEMKRLHMYIVTHV